MPTSPAQRRGVATTSALAAVLAVVLTACSGDLLTSGEEQETPAPSLSSSPIPAPSSRTPQQPSLDRYYSQDVDWKGCGDGHECATVQVPLDYAEPAGETIDLDLLRVPAEGGKAVGSLVVNPGGPGVPGTRYAADATSYFGTEIRQVFDIVGFDPRGVGGSTPIDCVSDEQLDAFVAMDPDPDTAVEERASDAAVAALGRGCVENSGDLAGHISTVEAARDIDVIRALLGDRRLSYFGASYGTFLGATYADLFPQRVGRMVLDGAIDPSLSSTEMSLVQAKGFETALRAYVGACVDRGGCFLGDSVDAGTARIREFLDDVERSPVDGADGRRLEIGNAVLGIWAPLYNQGYWPLLDSALRSAFAGDGALLLRLSDAYTSRTGDGYTDNSLEALFAVNCLDHDDAIPTAQVAPRIPEFERASPTFGKVFAYGLAGCAQWPVSGEQPDGPIDAAGAAPILVVGTSRDPATPLEWAEALAEQLDSGVLVRRDGDGHTGYNAGNPCVDDAVESYLVSGTVPESDVSC